jgi:GTPase SAR1 family protein
VDIYAPNAERILVGNKIDIPKAVNPTVAEGFADQKGKKERISTTKSCQGMYKWIEASAKNGDNVELAFSELARAVYTKLNSEDKKGEHVDLKKNPSSKTQKTKC